MPSITITVHKRKRKTRRAAAEREGSPIRGQRKEDYPARRQRPDLIVFYDLGQTAAGVTNSTHIANPADLSLGFDFPEPPDPDIDAMKADLDSSIFAYSEAAWKTTFKRIGKGSLWDKGITLEVAGGGEERLRDSSRWTASGLKLSPEDLADFRITFDPLLFNGFTGIADDILGDVKVTATLDPDASAVTFTPAAKMNIYLMPSFVSSTHETTYFDGDGNEVIEQLNYIWNVLDRPLYLPDDEIDYEAVMKSMQFARANRRVFPPGILESIDPCSYPGGGTPGPYLFELNEGANSQFLCAIETPVQWFYFWRA